MPGPALVPNVEPSIFAGISLGSGLITTADIFVAEESVVVKSICSWSLCELIIVDVRSGIESLLSTVCIKCVVDPQREVGRVALWRLSLSFTTSRADEVAGLV